jgi:hypothetical protein
MKNASRIIEGKTPIYPWRVVFGEHLLAYRFFSNRAAATVSEAIRESRLPRLFEWKNRYAGRSHSNKRLLGQHCVDCPSLAEEYDHRDYFEPLRVDPVCRRCSRRRGSAIKTLLKIVALTPEQTKALRELATKKETRR